MLLDHVAETELSQLLGAKLMRIYDRQSKEGRSAILAFLHLFEDEPSVMVRLDVERSGRMHLIVEAPQV